MERIIDEILVKSSCNYPFIARGQLNTQYRIEEKCSKVFIFPLALARRPISLVKTRITTKFRPRFFAPNGFNILKCLLFHSLSHFIVFGGECLDGVGGCLLYIDETHG